MDLYIQKNNTLYNYKHSFTICTTMGADNLCKDRDPPQVLKVFFGML